jgi:hypothetical protein
MNAILDLSIPEIAELAEYLTEDEKRELAEIMEADRARMMWRPLPGPQTMAYYCDADVLGYGGAAGGGKTDLMLGKSINQHRISYILRREATQMKGIYRRMTEIMGGTDGFNASNKLWRIGDGREVQFGSTPNLGDEMNYQGQARDFLGIDEAANFLRAQIIFLMGWVRTTIEGQQTQSLLTFNPPTTAEGRWLVDYFAPWLDDMHPNPAAPGELRWFCTLDGEELEWHDGVPFDYRGEWVIPQSRSFVPSRISDNPFLVRTNYMSTLQALPEPLRSQMLYGDFKAGMTDDPWQVIPTAWIKAAQERWTKRVPRPDFVSLGVDVARGGSDNTTIARCTQDLYFDELLEYPGKETPDGETTAALCIAANRNHAPIHIDVIGVGASPYDFLKNARQQTIGVNVSERSLDTDQSGRLSFKNQRSALWWKFRELLDPVNNHNVCLPPDRNLLVELAAPKWKVQGSTIYVESREDIIERIGRSPDRATAVIMAAIRTPRESTTMTREHAAARRAYNPANPGAVRRKFDPYGER